MANCRGDSEGPSLAAPLSTPPTFVDPASTAPTLAPLCFRPDFPRQTFRPPPPPPHTPTPLLLQMGYTGDSDGRNPGSTGQSGRRLNLYGAPMLYRYADGGCARYRSSIGILVDEFGQRGRRRAPSSGFPPRSSTGGITNPPRIELPRKGRNTDCGECVGGVRYSALVSYDNPDWPR